MLTVINLEFLKASSTFPFLISIWYKILFLSPNIGASLFNASSIVNIPLYSSYSILTFSKALSKLALSFAITNTIQSPILFIISLTKIGISLKTTPWVISPGISL